MESHDGELGVIAHHWFEVMRNCGIDIREVLHDGHATACVEDAAFAYVNVGFFKGVGLADPDELMEGTGKFMRHVKLRPGVEMDPQALKALIEAAYADMRGRLND